jgi:hypothetical protein
MASATGSWPSPILEATAPITRPACRRSAPASRSISNWRITAVNRRPPQARGNFARAPARWSEQQTRKIDAGHEQHHADGADSSTSGRRTSPVICSCSGISVCDIVTPSSDVRRFIVESTAAPASPAACGHVTPSLSRATTP